MDEPRHLLIDGYNILYAWGWLRPDESGARLDAARGRLIEALRVLRDVDRVTVAIVFDGRGAVASHDVASEEAGFAVVFAPTGRTADDIIEASVASARDPRACVVATADALERETVMATGASWLSPEELRAWCDRSHTRAVQAAARRAEKSRAAWNNRLPL